MFRFLFMLSAYPPWIGVLGVIEALLGITADDLLAFVALTISMAVFYKIAKGTPLEHIGFRR